MSILSALIIVSIFNYGSKVEAAYLTLDGSGSGFHVGNSLRLSNGDILIKSAVDGDIRRYNSKLEQKEISLATTSGFHELPNNRILSIDNSGKYSIVDYSGVKLSTVDSSLMTAIGKFIPLSGSDNLLGIGENNLYLLDSNLNIIDQQDLSGVISLQATTALNHKGDVIVVGYALGGGKDISFITIKPNLSYSIKTHEIIQPNTPSFVELGDGFGILVQSNTYVFDSQLNHVKTIVNSEEYEYPQFAGNHTYPLFDGTVLQVGVGESGVGFQILGENGNEIYSLPLAGNFRTITVLGEGRFAAMFNDQSYQIYSTAIGLSDNISSLEIPNNLRILSQSGSTANIGWSFESDPIFDHFEIYVNNALSGPTAIKNYTANFSSSGLNQVQVAAVDTSMKQTALSQPLFITNSELEELLGFNSNTTIRSGILNTTFTPLSFSQVTLGGAMLSFADSFITFTDSRGTAAGWSYNIFSTDFVQSIPDPSGGNGNIEITIPVSSIRFGTSNLDVITGQPVSVMEGPFVVPMATLSTVSQTILNSREGYGMGHYQADLELELIIPDQLQIGSVTGNGSKYEVGDLVGVYAGTYTGTVTLLATAGI